MSITVNIVSNFVASHIRIDFKHAFSYIYAVYVPINPLKGERFLEVTINTQQSVNNFNPRSTWKISVHQFECPLGQARKANTAVQVPQRQAKLGLFNDWVAPLGCLQYFNQPNGTVESFNLNNGVGELN